MKRFFTALLALMLLCALTVPVLADVAYEPDDAFFRRHSGECRHENRAYYTNGAEGFVLACDAPGSGAKAALPNGICYHIYYTYDKNGDLWGYVEFDPDDPANFENWRNFVPGWVPMADMTADYDNSAFFTEHGDEYVQKDAELEIAFQDTVYTYKYPGSGIVLEELHGDWARNPLTFTSVFVDPAGREWGNVGYYYGHRNFWVCLDDPYNAELPPDENFRAVNTVPAASAEVMTAALNGAKAPNLYVYAGAAGVIVIAAAVLVFVIRKKKRA